MKISEKITKGLLWNLIFAIILGYPLISNAIVIDSFSPAFHDRFANDGNFIANTFDLSGVAISSGNLSENGRWVTMLSENVFLSSNHFFPDDGHSVSFYGSNDPSGTSLTRTVSTSQQIGTSDLRIGVLSTPLPGDWGYYNFATQNTTNTNTSPGGPSAANSESWINSPYYNQNAYLIGRSVSSFTLSQDMAVGRNVLDEFFLNISGTNHAIGANYGGGNSVQYEAQLAGGDSGGPMFVEDGLGGLTLVGINWFVYNPDWGIGDGNGFSYVGNYSTEIESYIAANLIIPEMGTMVLFLLSSSMVAVVLLKRK